MATFVFLIYSLIAQLHHTYGYMFLWCSSNTYDINTSTNSYYSWRVHTTVKSRKYCGSIYTICFGAITKNGYDIPGPVFLQNGCTLKPSKNAPHEPSRYWLWSKAYRIRLLVLFWGTTTRRYTCWRLIIFDLSRFSLDSSSLTGIRSGYDQGAKAPEEFCGGNCVFFTWSQCMPVLCPILSTER